MASWEALAPRRQQQIPRRQRWPANLVLALLNIGLIRLLLASAAAGSALWAETQHFGLFNQLHLPYWLSFALSLILLDLLIYWQHRLIHLVPWLWRWHRVHHADQELDVSSGVRFHPVEALLSMGLKIATVALLGVPVSAVLSFELILNLCSTFHHSNVYLSPRLDKALRYLLVTPDLHRIHHSTRYDENNRNFGFSVPWWDQLFGSFLAQAQKLQTEIELGDAEIRDPGKSQGLWALLTYIPMKEVYYNDQKNT